jgi:selenocysteine lyase/cysteine desulfurase
MPDRFEPGSHNAIGLLGLSEGVQWILDRGVESLWDHQRSLIRTMLDGLAGGWAGHTDPELSMPGLRLIGPPGLADRCGVFSVRIDGYDDPVALSRRLEDDFGLLTRSGIHCAPGAHETFGTTPHGGTTRFSFGPFTQTEDVKYACDALGQLCHEANAVAVG